MKPEHRRACFQIHSTCFPSPSSVEGDATDRPTDLLNAAKTLFSLLTAPAGDGAPAKLDHFNRDINKDEDESQPH